MEAAMAAQVDALDPSARRVLRYASVLGRSFSLTVLKEVLRSEGQVLDEATMTRLADFLEEDGPDRMRFQNGAVCDTAYESVSYQARRRLHRNVAEALERSAPDPNAVAGALAWHFARSENHAQTWKYARLAAEQARQRYANAEAGRMYTMALDAARGLGNVEAVEEIDVLVLLGQAKERAGLLEDAIAALNRGLRLAADEFDISDLLLRRAAIKAHMRKFAGAIRDLRKGIRLLTQLGTPPAEAKRAGFESDLASLLFSLEKPAKALAQARRAAEHARAAGEQRALGGALITWDMASLMLEGPGSGDHLREALQIYESLGDLRMMAHTQSDLGVLCAIAGRWPEAVECFDQARLLSNRIGDTIGSAVPAVNLGEMLVKQRRFAEAEPVLKDAIAVFQATHSIEGKNSGEMNLARIMIERGEYREADQLLERVENEYRDADQPLGALEAAAIRAFGRARSGEPAAALALLDSAWNAAGADAQLRLPVVACERIPILISLDRFDEALRDVQRALAAAREQGMPYEEGLLLRASADVAEALGQRDDAAASEAARILRGLGVDFD
jgi:tetratricopeptide (TPR) repeat protein